MADLRRICAEATAADNVQSYIASGNLIFEADGTPDYLAARITEGIKDAFGFDVPILVFPEEQMRSIQANCPFPRDAGKQVHAFLCYEQPRLDSDRIAALKTMTEQVACIDQTVWLYAPDGIGRSKLAAKLEGLLGTRATARNLNTINKIVEVLEAQVEN
jgi:uncharacterized protein (DUF1697 family)